MVRGRFRFLSLALVAVLTMGLLVACGDDDDGTPPPLPEPTGATSTPTNGETPEPGNGNGNGETPPPGGALTLTMVDIDFVEDTLTVNAGEQVEIALINEGVLEHDISIDDIDVDYSVSGDATMSGDWDLHASLAPGASGSMTITVAEAGSYEYYCSVPGHREAGMVGTLIVQ